MRDARLLVWIMADPSRSVQLSPQQWTNIITCAQSERLLGSLAYRLEGLLAPDTVLRVFDRAKKATDTERTQALWEAEMCKRALAGLDVKTILLKGTAYVARGMKAGQGRQIGDLDILVPFDRLDDAEAALLKHGWEWVKEDAYDSAYYREHMHELPPLIHKERDRMIDVHHTILPRTCRITPDAAALIESAREGEDGLSTLSPPDMIIHAVAHLFADGDLGGGLRNLWDIHCMIEEFAPQDGFWSQLRERAMLHGLMPHVSRALRLSRHLYESNVDNWMAWNGRTGDVFYTGRLLARNGWGQETQKLLRFAFYIRSHWIRMPPLMLARHLWTKWRKA